MGGDRLLGLRRTVRTAQMKRTRRAHKAEPRLIAAALATTDNPWHNGLPDLTCRPKSGKPRPYGGPG